MMISGGGGAALEVLPQAPQPQTPAERALANLENLRPQLKQNKELENELKNILEQRRNALFIISILPQRADIVNVFKNLDIAPRDFIDALEKAGYDIDPALKEQPF